MKQESRRLDLDLDALSFVKEIHESDDECLFYFRKEGNKISSAYGGMSTNIVNGIIDLMKRYDDAYDIIGSAVSLFEEDTFQVKEKRGKIELPNVFQQYNIVCSSIAVMFSEKHQINFESWSGGVVGSKAIFGKDAVLFSDMVYDLEQEMPSGVYWQYINSCEDDYIAYCNYLENNSMYCDECDTLVDNNLADWNNDTPVCPYCSNKLEL